MQHAQLQAIFDYGSLEAAQNMRYNRIVAAGIGFPSTTNWEVAGNKLAVANTVSDYRCVY